MSKRVLFIDTETGGLDPQKHSLLSIGFVVWDDGDLIDEREFFVRSDDYLVTPRALDINKINLCELYECGEYLEDLVREIDEYISKYFSYDGWIIIGGHNVAFKVFF